MLVMHMCSSFCCPLPVSSLRASVHSLHCHYSVFSLPPNLYSDGNLCLALSIITYVHYIFRTTRTYFIILFLYIYIYLEL